MLLLFNILLINAPSTVRAESTNEVENVRQLNARIEKLNQEIEELETEMNESDLTQTQISSIQAQILEKEKQYEKIITLSEKDEVVSNLEDIPASKSIGSGDINQIIHG